VHCHLRLEQLHAVLWEIARTRDHLERALAPYPEMDMQLWPQQAQATLHGLRHVPNQMFRRTIRLTARRRGSRRARERAVDYRDIITIEPGKRGGKPCIRGMRITVYDVLGWLAAGMTQEEILADYPELTQEDIRACLAYAADRERSSLIASAVK